MTLEGTSVAIHHFTIEDHPQGPLVAGIQEGAPDAFAKRARRTGVVNALDDPGFADAAKATSY